MASLLGGIFRGGNSKKKRESEELKKREAEASKAKELRNSVAKQIKEDLWRALQNREEEHLMFVCGEDLERIWTTSRIEQLFKGFDWSNSRLWPRAQTKFLKVMSTLVWIDWNSWDDFGHLFLNHNSDSGRLDRTDEYLPFEDTSFLGPDKLRTFFRNQQYIFIPVLIMEDDEEDDEEDDAVYMQFSEKHRMPFVRTEMIGQGGSGIVTKEIIAPGQFGYKTGAYNKGTLLVARKRIPRVRAPGNRVDLSSTELKSLKSFKRCVEGNHNIMLSYTSFVHGPDVIIISPLADLDLHTFFEGDYHDFRIRSGGFTPAHLLYGASCLAGALSFLHEGLQPVGIAGKIFCAHLDLKPENILVLWKGNSEPAGRWLVHDFGTSKIKELSSPKTLAPGDFLRQFSLTQPQRAPGPFQAPEVQRSNERVVGTESDIWSLGCILAVVLAFAVGGPTHVTKLANSRAQEGFADDYFYIRQENKVTLKEEMKKWLDSLDNGGKGDIWIKETLSLIYRTLVEKPIARPSAKIVRDTLATIYNKQGIESLENMCQWVPVELPCIPPPPPAKLKSTETLRRPEPRVEPPQLIVERPTFINIEPGLEVVSSSSLSSPQSIGVSRFSPDRDSYMTEARGQVISRSSSTSTKPVSLTDDAMYMKVEVPKDPFKAVICHSACHVTFLSKKRATIVRLDNEGSWVATNKPPALNDDSRIRSIDSHAGFEWDFACSSGRYLILRSKKLGGKERKIFRYHCDESGRTWSEEHFSFSENVPISKLWNALDIRISIHGGVLFVCDMDLWFYSEQHGLLELFTEGRHRMDSVCFSPDGRWVFAWSHEAQLDHFYKWDTITRVRRGNSNPIRTLKQEWHIPAKHDAARRLGTGLPAVFPFLDYFVAFDIPDRVYTIGKDANKPGAIPVPREIRNIVAGVSVQGSEGQPKVESLILLKDNGTGLLMSLPMNFNGAGSPSEGSKLRNQFTTGKDAIAVLNTDSKLFVVIAHANGKLERRRILST